MKIVDRKIFLNMPAGIVFSKYEPCYFGPLSIKGETIRHGTPDSADDFYYQRIEDAIDCEVFTDAMSDYREEQVLRFDFDCESRDGLFDREQMFSVWDEQDVSLLVKKLSQSLL